MFVEVTKAPNQLLVGIAPCAGLHDATYCIKHFARYYGIECIVLAYPHFRRINYMQFF
ncbi:hypothetical protein D3C81_941960 [compost metagenome]